MSRGHCVDSDQAAKAAAMRQVERMPAPWRLVPVSDYEVPSVDRADSLKNRWTSLYRLFSREEKEVTVARAEADLRALPGMRLANLVPPIDWSSPAQALTQAFDEIASQGGARHAFDPDALARTDCPIRFLVGQPYCDHAAMVQDWAARHGALELVPPGASQILAADQSWLQALPARSHQVWALPALERCFLRQAKGLDLVRRFLERALCGELGPGMIACDSWAFAFIQRVWPFPSASVLTLQAFDAAALADYFVRPWVAADSPRRTRFLSARSAEPLLPEDAPQQSDAEHAEREREQSLPELRLLAAHCRGNPGLAWHYWRKQLRSEPDPEQQEQAVAHEHAGPAASDVVWVAQDLEAPALPAGAGEDIAFVLHALLLHRGLSTELLALLLPMPQARVASQLLRLQALGLLVREGACWQVAPLAYPTVREFLRARGYLVDAF